MAEQTRRRAPKSMTRRERRSSGARTYNTPSRPVSAPTAMPRRSYMAEPAPVDYTTEYYYVRKDLMRILIWATVLIVAIIGISFLPIF